jgi:hypothetical protein
VSTQIRQLDQYELNKLLNTFYFMEDYAKMKQSLRDFPSTVYLVDVDTVIVVSNREEITDWLIEYMDGRYLTDDDLGFFFFKEYTDALHFYLTWGTRFV